jgi:ankyrin repeat protein
LFEAAAADRFDDVAYIIATHPEKIDFYAEDGFTALGLASYFGSFDIARYLVLKGADVNRPSDNGFNVYPLHSAAAGNFTSTATMLIENGADVNVKQASRYHAAAFGRAKRQPRIVDITAGERRQG